MKASDCLLAILLVGVAMVCGGCVARRAAVGENYRLAGEFLLPPGSPEQPESALEMTVALGDLGRMPIKRSGTNCTIRDRWFSLFARRSGSALNWTATVPLPAAWRDPDLISNVHSDWNHFFDQMSGLQEKGCMSRNAYWIATSAIAESMPAPVMYALFFRYSFGSEGYVKLRPGMRLFVERSLFRNEQGDTHKVSNYLGERKVYYDVVGSQAKRLALRRHGEWRSKGLPARAGAEYPDTGLSREFEGMRALRLFVLTLFVPPNVHRNSLLIGVRNPEEMVRVTREIRKNPEIPCKELRSRGAACASFAGVVSASVEMNVRVNGRREYFPIGSTVETALGGVRGSELSAAMQTLRIQRLFRGAYREVEFAPGDSEVGRLALFAGDRISWEAKPARVSHTALMGKSTTRKPEPQNPR